MVAKAKSKRPRKRDVFTRRRDGSLVLKLNVNTSKFMKEEQEKLKLWREILGKVTSAVYFAKEHKPLPKHIDGEKLLTQIHEIRNELYQKMNDLNPEKGKKVTLT